MTPKMHFGIHYPNILDDVGPLCHVSSIRFESFHKIFKNVTKNVTCRKNLLKTCIFKLRMRYANFFLNFNSFFDPEIQSGKLTPISRDKIVSNFHCDIPLPENLFAANMVQKNSVIYKVWYVIQTGESFDQAPQFALITNVFVHGKEILLGCQHLTNLGFNTHFHAYRVEKEDFNFVKSINPKNIKTSYFFSGVDKHNYVLWD